MKTKLIGSAGSLDALLDLLIKKWQWTDASLNDDGTVLNSKGELVEGLRWTKQRNRFRLELILEG